MTTLQADDNGLPLPGRERDPNNSLYRHSSLTMGQRDSLMLVLDDNGLPKPGRLLDAWIAENILGRDPLNARTGLHENGDLEYYWGYPIGHDIAGYYSTTAAFFQVMEADDHLWATFEDESSLLVKRYPTSQHYVYSGGIQVRVSIADYPSREKAYAHAVCCCVYLWKTQQ